MNRSIDKKRQYYLGGDAIFPLLIGMIWHGWIFNHIYVRMEFYYQKNKYNGIIFETQQNNSNIYIYNYNVFITFLYIDNGMELRYDDAIDRYSGIISHIPVNKARY